MLGTFMVITHVTLQQSHAAGTMINFMIQVKELRCREQRPGQGHTSSKWWSWAGQSELKQVWEFGKRIKLLRGPWGQHRASGIQTGKARGQTHGRGTDKWVLTLGEF